jgi:hypothetical protein
VRGRRRHGEAGSRLDRFFGLGIRGVLEMGLFSGSNLGGPHDGVASFFECGGESPGDSLNTARNKSILFEIIKMILWLLNLVFSD